jgi:predicted phage baseplate assembly protein
LLEEQSILVREREAPSGEELVTIKSSEGEDAIREARRGGYWVRWTEVDSLYDSGPRSRHYVVDRLRGAIKFGDGKKGLIPGAGSANIMAERYRIGGGARGNVTAGMITTLRRTVAHIDTVYNPFPAAGGSDQETVDEAKIRGPHVIKSRNRAVTAEDFEWLTLEASNGIARARCINTIGREGEVTVVVVPKQDARRRDLTVKPVPSTELLRRVKHFLDERRLISTKVHVVKPRFAEISITVEVIRTNAGSSEAMRKAVDDRLRTFLHPLIGGRNGAGWDFGRNVLKLDLYHVIEDVDGVDVVHRIRLYDEDARQNVDHVKVAEDQLVHLVDVTVIEKPREQFR